MRARTQSQLARTPDISPADVHSVDGMAAILHKVMIMILIIIIIVMVQRYSSVAFKGSKIYGSY